jgi:hypothetical protein
VSSGVLKHQDIIQTHTQEPVQCQTEQVISLVWKTTGAMVKSKGITSHSYFPIWVVKAIFSQSIGQNVIWWQPDVKSNEEKHILPLKLINEVVNSGNGVSVLESQLQFPIINAYHEAFIGFWHKEHRCSVRRAGWHNAASFQ